MVDWAYLPNTRIGMSPVTSYNLWWDEGSQGQFWYSLIGLSEPILSQSSFTVTNGVLEGQDYKFKIRAKNIWGWGAFSPVGTIRASAVPNQVSNIITSYDTAATNQFRVTWSQPKNNGDLITAYKIEVYSDPTDQWNEVCDGTQADVVLYRICLIPIATLFGAPHSLIFNQFVRVRVSAANVIGFGPTGVNSPAVSDTRLKSWPLRMYQPARGDKTSVNQLEVTWQALLSPNNGNSDVLSYNLQWDAGTGDCTMDLVGATVPYTGLSYIVTQGITFDRTYCFRVRALNVYGWGEFSYLSYVRTSDRPGQMEIVYTDSFIDELDGISKIRISWQEPEPNGEFITKYQIKVQTWDLSTFVEPIQYCDGSDPQTIANMYCDIPMTVLRADPYKLSKGQLIIVVARAFNLYEWGQFSQVNVEGATLETEPVGVTTLAFVDTAESNNMQVKLSWTKLTSSSDIGGSPLTKYTLYQRLQGQTTWTVSQTITDTTLSQTVVTGLTGGQNYEYLLSASNTHGESSLSLSNVLRYRASQVPDTPDAVVTSVVTNVNVKIQWTAPNANSQPILEYQVVIANRDGSSFIETKALCDGSRNFVLTSTYCIIPITSLRSAPYSLVKLDLIKAKVRARNVRGWSELSLANTAGATVKTEPEQMGVPVNGPLTDEYRIDVSWSALSTPLNGDSDITSYNLQYDNGTQGFIWYSIVGEKPSRTDLSYRVTTGVVPGRIYGFRVRARNAFGWGDFSSYITLKTAVAPYQMMAPSTSIDEATGNVKIAWFQPADGSDPITKYSIEIMYKGQNVGEESASYCDGSQLATRTCIIPLSVLTASPFNYVFDDIVRVRATSTNSFGTGQWSTISTTGAKIRQVPSQMAMPFMVSRTKATMTIRWVGLTAPATGNSDVLSHNLYWDNGLGDTSIELLDDLVTEISLTGLTGGVVY